MTRTARIEGRVQIGIMLLMGGGAGAASFKHIHDLAVAYGQPSWIGWANAVVVELMSIVAGLEIRRRKRTGQPAGFVYLVFFGAVLISLAANVAKAHPSPWGWIMAALPALGFLAVVKIVLTRQPIETEPVRSGAELPGPAPALGRTPNLGTRILEGARADALPTGPAEQPDRALAVAGPDRTTADENTGPVGRIWTETTGGPGRLADLEVDRSIEDRVVPVQRVNGHHAGTSTAGPTDNERRWPGSDLLGTRTGPDCDRSDTDVSGLARSGSSAGPLGTRTSPDRDWPDVSGPDRARTGLDDDLLELGKTAAVTLAMRKAKLTRETLIKEIRDSGGTIGTDRANDLLRWLKEDEAASVGTN